jgi:hypothetical protein
MKDWGNSRQVAHRARYDHPVKPRRPRRRLLLRLGLLVLAGAAVNVAVAWTIALPSKPRASLLGPRDVPGQWLSCGNDSMFVRSGELGISRHVPLPGRYALGTTQVDFSKQLTVAQFAAKVPSWSAFSVGSPPHRYLNVVQPEDHCLDISEKTTGWPCLTLRAEAATRTTMQASRIYYSNGLRLPGASRTRGSIVLPIMPLWPGFAINTVLYAAVCWLLFAAPFVLRRRLRLRLGRCPNCAYPVGQSPVCTECGKPVRRTGDG